MSCIARLVKVCGKAPLPRCSWAKTNAAWLCFHASTCTLQCAGHALHESLQGCQGRCCLAAARPRPMPLGFVSMLKFAHRGIYGRIARDFKKCRGGSSNQSQFSHGEGSLGLMRCWHLCTKIACCVLLDRSRNVQGHCWSGAAGPRPVQLGSTLMHCIW